MHLSFAFAAHPYAETGLKLSAGLIFVKQNDWMRFKPRTSTVSEACLED
jgi:hypothetical protein